MRPVSDSIQFLLNDQLTIVNNVAPTLSVLKFLRDKFNLTGTSEGCAEGDCDACTVIVGERKGDDLQLRSVNACILLLPTLHGKMLYTIEHLIQNNGRLHPVQQAMKDCNGSQCSFCTPGIVMSLWGYYLDKQVTHSTPSTKELCNVLSGNLCRCTGYKPILEAGMRMFELPAVDYDQHSSLAQLNQFTHAMTDQKPQHLHFQNIDYYAPRTLHQLLTLSRENPDSTVLAGCTDIGLWINKKFHELNTIIYLGNVESLRNIEVQKDFIRIGAAVSLSDAYDALEVYYPQVRELRERFASAPIRNAGTLVGNLANGSPVGDSAPWLIAVGAQVEIQNLDGRRIVPLDELYIGYQQQARARDEILTAVTIPLPSEQQRFRTWKVTKHNFSDISAVCGAFQLTLANGSIIDARVAYGGMAATSKRADHCEQELLGKPWNSSCVESAMSALDMDYTPISDKRATAEYRSLIAKNLLLRFYLETRSDQSNTAIQACSISQLRELK